MADDREEKQRQFAAILELFDVGESGTTDTDGSALKALVVKPEVLEALQTGELSFADYQKKYDDAEKFLKSEDFEGVAEKAGEVKLADGTVVEYFNHTADISSTNRAQVANDKAVITSLDAAIHNERMKALSAVYAVEVNDKNEALSFTVRPELVADLQAGKITVDEYNKQCDKARKDLAKVGWSAEPTAMEPIMDKDGNPIAGAEKPVFTVTTPKEQGLAFSMFVYGKNGVIYGNVGSQGVIYGGAEEESKAPEIVIDTKDKDALSIYEEVVPKNRELLDEFKVPDSGSMEDFILDCCVNFCALLASDARIILVRVMGRKNQQEANHAKAVQEALFGGKDANGNETSGYIEAMWQKVQNRDVEGAQKMLDNIDKVLSSVDGNFIRKGAVRADIKGIRKGLDYYAKQAKNKAITDANWKELIASDALGLNRDKKLFKAHAGNKELFELDGEKVARNVKKIVYAVPNKVNAQAQGRLQRSLERGKSM